MAVVIVHDVTSLMLRFLLGAILDAHARGVLTPVQTPALWQHVEAILAWCGMAGDETV